MLSLLGANIVRVSAEGVALWRVEVDLIPVYTRPSNLNHKRPDAKSSLITIKRGKVYTLIRPLVCTGAAAELGEHAIFVLDLESGKVIGGRQLVPPNSESWTGLHVVSNETSAIVAAEDDRLKLTALPQFGM